MAAGAVGAIALLAIAAILFTGPRAARDGRSPLRLLRRRRRPELDAHAAAARRQLGLAASALVGGLHEARLSVEAAVADLARHWDRRQSSGLARRG